MGSCLCAHTCFVEHRTAMLVQSGLSLLQQILTIKHMPQLPPNTRPGPVPLADVMYAIAPKSSKLAGQEHLCCATCCGPAVAQPWHSRTVHCWQDTRYCIQFDCQNTAAVLPASLVLRQTDPQPNPLSAVSCPVGIAGLQTARSKRCTQ
jgi:hypothetical protein